MKTSTYSVVDETTEVSSMILTVGTQGRVMYLEIGFGPERVTLQVGDPAFLDKLSNEADRLCREFVGDVPPLEIGGTAPVSVGPEVIP